MKNKILKNFLVFSVSASLLLGATNFNLRNAFAKEGYVVSDFANIIDLNANLSSQPYAHYQVSDFSTFMDKGSWHGYSLPELSDKQSLGGFAGPTVLFEHKSETMAINLAKNLSQIHIMENEKEVDLQFANPKLNYYPGKLVQTYETKTFKLSLELIFATDRTAFIKTTIENLSDKELNLKVKWDGTIFKNYTHNKKTYEVNPKLQKDKNMVKVVFDGENKGLSENTKNNSFFIMFDENMFININNNGSSYDAKLEKPLKIEPKKSFTTYRSESFVFDQDEYKKEVEKIKKMDKAKAFVDNNARWQGYLDKTFKGKKTTSKSYDDIAIKSMETLITNWRSPAGDIKTSGITPSVSYRWFNGFWAWDSWKNAMGVLDFDPQLAKDAIKTMFDYQITKNDEERPQDAGTIIDAVYYEESNNNHRNSKPPLAAWAVYNVYKKTGDIEFVKEMYPKLVDYHNWWYTNRDTDKNGIAEFGAMVHDTHYKHDKDGNILKDKNNKPIIDEDEIITAAAWESGMDNAIRFDKEGVGKDDIGVKVFENTDKNGKVVGYSINQESVDLNAFLYAEKGFLKSLAEVLNKKDDVLKYEKEAKMIKDYVEKYMFDEKTGFYYDLQISKDGKNKKLLVNRGKGTEGYLPLWAKISSKEKAKKVVDNILDPNKFNLKVPFPTASKDNPLFNPNKYWRGPVWLDQALFGVEALENYGYKEEAKELTRKLMDNAEGLISSGTIRENYNPVTGEGLHAKNFSWSAAAYYLLYKNTLQENENTSQVGFDIK